MYASGRLIRSLPGSRALGAFALAFALLAAAGAHALTIADTNPIFLLGGGDFGFAKAAIDAAGLPVADTATPADAFLSAGNEIYSPLPELSITQSLGPIYQNPQADYLSPASGCQAGDVCQTPTNPFLADSTWTVTNHSGHDIASAFLIFLRVSDGYPDIPVALDGNLIQILEYTDTDSGNTYWLAMLALGALGDGNASDATPEIENPQSTHFSMRYIVGGDMPFSGSEQVMPPIDVLGLERTGPVPEPGTALLLASGLVALGMAKRSRV